MEVEQVMGGFLLYLVEMRNVSPLTAVNYQRAVVTQITASLGFCPKLGHEWRWLTLVVNGIKKHHFRPKRRRDPITPKMLILMKRQFQLNTHMGRTFWALILFLMYSVSRKGDNIPDSAKKFVQGKHVVKADITVETHEGIRCMVLRRTMDKTSRYRKEFGPKVLPEGDSPLSAFSALAEMMENDPLKSDPKREQLPLFHDGTGVPITGPQLLKVLRGGLEMIGETPEHFGTHSLRIGGATLAMSCPGATEYTVKMLGYWASEAVRLYTRPTRGAMLDLGKKMMLTTNLNLPR
jgi:hypothetical protein